MTGEITLHGKVLPIGGLKEKTMAAYKADIKTVIVPYANKTDISEIDKTVRESLEFVYARTLDDVLEAALVKSEKMETVEV
jgi:ATP-dependent Lon protease